MVELSVTRPFGRAAQLHNAWIAPFVSLGLLLAFYAGTAATAVEQWEHSSAYSYAFLIAPISAFLIWRDRAGLSGAAPEPYPAGFAVIFVFACVWLAADVLGIAEGQHFALMGMIQGLLLTVLGLGLYRFLAFPFLYLWLMVPTGTVLITLLQKVSHAGALALIQLSGIPVFADGMVIDVPEGRFIVEPGCAGLNFILAGLALSLLYGKINYRSARARIACVAIALGAAVVSNILRIYLIIVLTQVTHRKLDIAEDHLLYGWGFFGVIMLAMMWWGGRYAAAEPVPEPRPVATAPPAPLRTAVFAAAAVLLAAAPLAVPAGMSHAAANSGVARFLHGLAPSSSSPSSSAE